jgi:O-antigen/teichoic acid export membrane protein
MAQTLRRNARVSTLTWVWAQGINLIRMMMLINFLSTEGYGLWIFSFSIMSYFVVYNFGIANAFVKYTAEYNARGEHDRLGQILSTGMTAGLLIGAGIIVFFFFFTESAIQFFNIHVDNAPDARFVIFGVAIVSAFSMVTSVYGAVLTGIQRLDIRNYCFVAGITIEFFFMVAALNLGYGIKTVTVLYTCNVIFSNLLCLIAVRRLLPEVHINPFRPRLDCVPPLFTLGGKMQLLGIVAMLVGSLDIVVFMKYGGEAFVGVYGSAQRFAQRAQGLALQGFGMLAPASADLLAREEHGALAEVYRGAQRFTAIGCAFVFGYLALYPDITMIFVMDEQYVPGAAFALRVLCFGLFFHTLTGPGTSMMRGAGLPFREMAYQVLTVVMFLAMFYPLMHAWSPDALKDPSTLDPRLVATWPLALGAASLFFIVIANRFFKVSLWAPFGETGFLLISVCGLAWLTRFGWDAIGMGAPLSRWPAFFSIVCTGTLYTVLCGFAAFLLPGLTPGDREQVIRFLPGGSRALARRSARQDTP